ncbi:MarR family winged helix-turn-helix transcriptional regulator, partial [Blautia hydrogenotrophica]
MSSVAKSLSVTVGTLTIAMNNLVKKGYVNRARSEEDRRVVLISLSEKGEKAYYHHQKFHDDMIQAIMTDLDETQMDALTQALNKLRAFFRKY